MMRYFGFILLLIIFLLESCSSDKTISQKSLVNSAHLDRLTENIELNGQEMAIVHIYADAPEYEWTEAPGEGIACVDDVARAGIFYLREFQHSNDTSALKTAKKLLNFILYMQADNGRFYNFILADYSINKTRENSLPVDNWWTWRALWVLAEGYSLFLNTDAAFAQQIALAINKGLPAVAAGLKEYPKILNYESIKQAKWLPVGGAADQAAVVLLALGALKKQNFSPDLDDWINKYVEGILEYQIGHTNQFPHGAFLTWRNIWHAWGNNQAHSVMTVAQILDKKEWVGRAVNEVKYFYPYLMAENYLWQFAVKKNGEDFTQINREQFPQIAYGIRPMVWASLAAGNSLNQPEMHIQAAEIGAWLLGKNITGKALYDPKNGRCYDGINNSQQLNLNSGAESTIEALLTIQEIEQHPVAKKRFFEIYDEINNK